ncbi:hypothetical protein TWF506_010089 [Arthrobotrys conoides]|uniref:Uncharacterized protein n=1 Tax=Arthrobotrys conoides TaxID=74498 RepID=A0AAN8RWM1_9PEZI
MPCTTNIWLPTGYPPYSLPEDVGSDFWGLVSKRRKIAEFRSFARHLEATRKRTAVLAIDINGEVYVEIEGVRIEEVEKREKGSEKSIAERVRTAQRKVEDRRPLLYFAPNGRRYCY